jgi:D-sedoheptulose 7-phosphate isomerase
MADLTSGLVSRRLDEHRRIFEELAASDAVVRAGELAARVVASLRSGGKVIFFGNGGSSMDAGHLAAELLGRFYRDRPSLPAVSLPDSTAAVTAIGNDYSYAEVFARQLRGLARAGDVAIGLTTSGNSPNVVEALTAAKELGVVAAVLTGAGGGRVKSVADICIEVPTADTPRVQEACMHLGHSICEIVEREMFPEPA